jgi:glycogen(starch) synthase
MRILYWTPFFLPDIGGIEVLAAKALPKLQQRNYDLVVVTSHGRYDLADETQYNGISIYRFHTRSALGKGNLIQLIGIRQQVAKLKQSFEPDLVHINFSDPSVYFHLSTANAYPAPTLVTLHQNLAYFGLKGGLDTLLGQTLSMADWVTAVSGVTLSGIQAFMPKIRERSSVIYNGLDTPDLLPEPLPFETPQMLCVGRLLHQKGFDLAITAFAALLDRFPRARLTIVGDGPSRFDLEQQAAALGLGEAVEFKGRISPEHVPELMNKATIVVMPSRSEGFPMVALEAAQMARPIVATPVGGLPESVVHQQTGLLVEPEDSLALAEAIAFLLSHPDIARQMGQAGRSRALDIFSMERFVDAYDALYRKLIQEATPAQASREKQG